MKVLMATPRYPPNIRGGGERSCQLLVNELSKHLHIDVLSYDGDVEDADGTIDGIAVHRIKPTTPSKIINNVQVYYHLKKIMTDYDIIHTYNMSLMPSVGYLTKKYDVTSVATLNGLIFSPSMSTYLLGKHASLKFYRNKVMMRYIRNIKNFTALCPLYRDRWIADGIPAERIAIIPNMIDGSYTPMNKKRHPRIRLLSVGEYTKWRGYDTLLDAYSRIDRQDNIELVIAGMNTEKLKEKVFLKYDISNDIKILGRVPLEELMELYSKSDILVLPYLSPMPISRVIIEAMQNEICVITSGDDHSSPIIRDMKDGILLYPMNSKNLAMMVQRVISNKELREKLAVQGKRRVYEICSPANIVRKYLEIYQGS